MRTKQVSKKRKFNQNADVPDLITTHFPTPPLRKRYFTRFVTRSVIDSYFVNLVMLQQLSICGKTLKTLLFDMGWKNVLLIKEPVFRNLVRVFYSNMQTSSEEVDRVTTNVAGIPIEFDAQKLNTILKTSNDGFCVYSSRHRIEETWFSVVDAVRNICRRSDLSEKFCHGSLKSQALPLQVRVLHNILQHIISHRKGHSDEVTRLDVVLLDSILVGRKLNVGYIILQHMRSTLGITTRSLPFGSIISRILTHFRVPIAEPAHDEPKELGPDVLGSLGFERDLNYVGWFKNENLPNKPTQMAPTDHKFFNDVLPPDKLPDLSIYLRGQRSSRPSRCPAPPPAHPPNAPSSSSDVPEDRMQQLLSEVHSISKKQNELETRFVAFYVHFQSEQQRLFAQHQQILEGQQLILRAVGILPPSASSSPPPHQ